MSFYLHVIPHTALLSHPACCTRCRSTCMSFLIPVLLCHPAVQYAVQDVILPACKFHTILLCHSTCCYKMSFLCHPAFCPTLYGDGDGKIINLFLHSRCYYTWMSFLKPSCFVILYAVQDVILLAVMHSLSISDRQCHCLYIFHRKKERKERKEERTKEKKQVHC